MSLTVLEPDLKTESYSRHTPTKLSQFLSNFMINVFTLLSVNIWQNQSV